MKIDPSVFSSNLATFDNDGERAPASWTFAVINPQRASSLVDRLNWLGHLRLDPDAAEPHVHDAFRQAIQKLLSREDRPRLAEQIRVTPTREVTLFRGQPGMIADRSLMPIFRGVKPVPGESGKTVDVVTTHLLNDGLKLQLVPFFLEGGHVRLECRLTLSSVFDAREVDTSVELSVGQTLLIGANGLKHKDGAGDEQAMLLMVRPTRITPFSDSVSQGLLTNVHYYVGALKPRDFDSLIELITTTVDPESWRTMGGQGIIAQSSTNRILIRQTSEAHAQIVNLLAGLRHRRDERRQWERAQSIGARHAPGAAIRKVADENMENTVYFVEGSAEMLDGEESKIGVIASEVRDEPRTIEVRGHTTAMPLAADSPYRNHEDLAYQRAFQIREALIQMGIDKSRILLTVAGANEPLHIGHDPEKVKQNARVEVYWGVRGPASFLIAR